MDYSLKEVAGRIKDLREAKGYTQEELAKLTGVSAEDYKELEKGESGCMTAFDIPPKYLSQKSDTELRKTML